MAKLRQRCWLGGVLLTAVALSVGACGDDDDTTPPPGSAGSGGSGGKHPTAGQAGSAQAGTSAGHAGDGGTAGQGGQSGQAGEAPCVDGLQVVKVVDGATGGIIGWPTEHRIGAYVAEGIVIYELGDDGTVTQVEKLDPEELGLGVDGSISWLTRYGKGLVVQGLTADKPPETRIVTWQPGAEPETVPNPEPASRWFYITAADPDVGIAAATKEGVRLATSASDTWTWSEPFDHGGRRSKPLALEDERMLVGVEELDRLSLGGAGNEGGAGGAGNEGGAGGAVEAPNNSRNARLEWWSLQGQRLETHQAVGNPQVALKVAEGWLIGETNSFWGSYRAAIELLPETGVLHKLTDVPVISAGDGIDGAHDLALLGQRLFVANCESGLRAGAWSTSSLSLSSLPGPWQTEGSFSCSPSQVETQGDFVVMGGENLVFTRVCE